MPGPAHRPWQPLSLTEVRALFAPVTPRWWIAGGHAIELAVGRRLREHDDVDVLLLRPDQSVVHHALPGWQCWAADPPGTLRPWPPGETLPPTVHDIWCRPAEDAPWQVQVMLDEFDGAEWTSRRDRALHRPIDRLGHLSPEGIPYLATDIELFYKAKTRRPKDETDFTAALPVLDAAQRAWLSAAIERTFPRHPWLVRLRGPVSP